MGAKSPLLWDKGQVDHLLAGSPVVNMVKDRLKVLISGPCDASPDTHIAVFGQPTLQQSLTLD